MKSRASTRKIKVVLFASPRLVLRYQDLAAKYGMSRSELMRVTLQRGFQSTEQWCRRQHERFHDDEGEGAASGGSGSSAELSSASAASPVASLAAYGGALVDQHPDLDQADFRTMVSAHGATMGISQSQLGPLVDELVSSTFPSAGGDPGDLCEDDEVDAAAAPVADDSIVPDLS